MPILSFSMRSQEIDNPATETDTIATKTIKLNETYKMKYLKLLHIYHNIDYSEIHDPDDSAQASNTILFARFSFLSGKQSIFYEFKDNEKPTYLIANNSKLKKLFKLNKKTNLSKQIF